jgi:hypothetical protein
VNTLSDPGEFVGVQGPNGLLDLFNTHTVSSYQV